MTLLSFLINRISTLTFKSSMFCWTLSSGAQSISSWVVSRLQRHFWLLKKVSCRPTAKTFLFLSLKPPPLTLGSRKTTAFKLKIHSNTFNVGHAYTMSFIEYGHIWQHSFQMIQFMHTILTWTELKEKWSEMYFCHDYDTSRESFF